MVLHWTSEALLFIQFPVLQQYTYKVDIDIDLRWIMQILIFVAQWEVY